MKTKLLSFMIILALTLVACAQLVPGNSATFTSPAPETNTSVPAQPTSTPVPSPMPTQLTPAEQAAVAAMSSKYGIAADAIRVVKSEPVTWPTGCLGVVIPGVMCTQLVTDGYKITLEANNQQYEFHTNLDGSSVIDAAQQLATLKFAVADADHNLSLVNPTNLALGPTYNPAFNGFLPSGGTANGVAYVMNFGQRFAAFSIDGNGVHPLDFIQNPNYALAVWSGSDTAPSKLAWGTQLVDPSHPSTLQVSNADGSQLETLLTGEVIPNQPTQLVAEFWSPDGQSLYFSKEPVGIGGYILFDGATDLYRIDLATKAVTPIIPLGAANAPIICLDAISGDLRYVADHCAPKAITIRDLSNGTSVSIQPPADLANVERLGSARFSPDGKRVAFALAKGNPDAEQGWLAVADATGAAAKLIYTGQPGSYLTVHGWLDDATLLVEAHPVNCGATCGNTLWTIGADGSNPTQVAQGSLLAVVDNR